MDSVDKDTELGPGRSGAPDSGAVAQQSAAHRVLPGAMMWEADPWAVHVSFACNSGAALLGYGPEEPSGDGFLKRHIHADDWGRVLATMYSAIVEGGVRQCQHRMRRADSSTFWAQTSVQRSHENGVALVAGLTVDITAVKDAEDESRSEALQVRMLVDNIRDYAVFMVSPTAR